MCSCLASLLVQTFICLCLGANEVFSYAYEHSHVRTHEPFSPFVPFDSCWKTASRASATNSEANGATNDEANMWLVRSLFALPLAQMHKCDIRYGIVYKLTLQNYCKTYFLCNFIFLWQLFKVWVIVFYIEILLQVHSNFKSNFRNFKIIFGKVWWIFP